MKKYSYLLSIVLAFAVFAGCTEDSFDGEPMGDAGNTLVSFPEGPSQSVFLPPFDDVRKVDLFSILKNAHSNASLNTAVTVMINDEPQLVDEYNDENGTALEWLPMDIYTLANDAFSQNGDGYQVSFEPGDFVQAFTIDLDGSKYDLTKQYAVAFSLGDAGGLSMGAGKDTVFVILGVQSIWEGTYDYTIINDYGTIDGNVGGTLSESGVKLSTVGPNKVRMDGLWRTYSGYSEYQFNGDNTSIDEVVAFSGSILSSAIDNVVLIDPENRIFEIHWTGLGRGVKERFVRTGD